MDGVEGSNLKSKWEAGLAKSWDVSYPPVWSIPMPAGCIQLLAAWWRWCWAVATELARGSSLRLVTPPRTDGWRVDSWWAAATWWAAAAWW